MYKESETLELKASTGEWKEAIIALVAFANKRGGKVIIGVDDQGAPMGLTIGKGVLEDLVNKIKHHTDPVLYPSVNVKTFGLGEIIEIEIAENDNKPVFAFEKAYVRVGKANQKLSTAAVRDLIKRYTLPVRDNRSIPRNKALVAIFHGARQIEGWGSGFQKIHDFSVKNGNGEPQYAEKSGAFVVTFRKRGASEGINEGVNGGINEGISRLASYLAENPGKRVSAISRALDVPAKTIERWLKTLRERGAIEFRGSKKTGGYYSKNPAKGQRSKA